MIESICIDIGKLKWSNVIISSYLIYSFGLGYPSGPSPPTLVLYLDMILLIICKKSFNSSYLWCFLLMENYCSDDHWPSSMLYAPWAQQTFDNKHWPVLTWDDALSQWRDFPLHAKHLWNHLSEKYILWFWINPWWFPLIHLLHRRWPKFRSKHL